jgi:parvulin-like peptidyl-prolyl isomerase
VIREPLLQFLFLGAGLFLLYSIVNEDSDTSPDRIVIDAAEVTVLAEQFQRTWMRPPTRQELKGLTEDLVKEEILYREALALGLDKNDLVIRRRMRQKMEFLTADLVEQREPTDAELQTYLEANPEKFEEPARYSFRQIYLKPESPSDDVGARAVDLLARLQSEPSLGADPQSFGDVTLLPSGLDLASDREISSVFGTEFSDALVAVEPGAWHGPLASSYGLHLVHLTGKEEGSLPPLERVRPMVEREWSNERRQEANDRFYQALRERYSVEIRLRDTAPDRDNLAAHTQ